MSCPAFIVITIKLSCNTNATEDAFLPERDVAILLCVLCIVMLIDMNELLVESLMMRVNHDPTNASAAQQRTPKDSTS